jgi:hypothetical protein
MGLGERLRGKVSVGWALRNSTEESYSLEVLSPSHWSLPREGSAEQDVDIVAKGNNNGREFF